MLLSIKKLNNDNLNDHANYVKANVEKDIIAASTATTTFSNKLQKALNGAIYHALITGKNNLPNNLITSLSKDRVTNGRSQAVLSKYMLTKLKDYILHFVPFLEINKGDAKVQYPLVNKTGTKEGLQLSQDDINNLVNNLPLFTAWKKPKKVPQSPKTQKTLIQEFQSFFTKNVEKLIGETIENDEDLKLFNSLIELINSLPAVEADDLELAKETTEEKTELKKVV